MDKAVPLQQALIPIARALNLFRLATNIVSVFIPLIILSSGGKLQTIALFYVLYALIKLCSNYTCMHFIQRRGAHFGLALGFVFSGCQMVSILGYAHSPRLVLLLCAAASFALTNAFLWNAQHFFISRMMSGASKSSSLASIEVYGRLTDIFGPIIGGVFGSLFGAQWLLLLGLSCLVLTVIPLRRIRAVSLGETRIDAFTYTLRGAPRGDLLANFSFNIETLIGKMAWPIYLAVALHTYRSIGTVAAIAAIASIITTSIAGHRGDRGEDRAVLREGVFASSLIDVARLAATASGFIAFVSAAYEASLAYFSNAWTSTYYHHAKRHGTQYIVSMEIVCDLAYVAFWGLFFLLSLTIHSSRLLFNVVFLIAAVAAWGCLFITKQRR